MTIQEDENVDSQTLANALGIFASFAFLLQYIPQMYLNFKRKSVRGFSTTGIIIKLVGASFLLMNSYMTGELLAVVLYGLFNVFQHSVFMIQFSMYSSDSVAADHTPVVIAGQRFFLLWLAFPVVPFLIARFAPQTIAATNMIKPITQVLSHIPQLELCYRLKTTQGVSLMSQHLNFVGGLAGLAMCFITKPQYLTTYFIYLFSVLQAVSLYGMALWYDILGHSNSLSSTSRTLSPKIVP
jgi:uncharacterized protein with PQ loop repeat